MHDHGSRSRARELLDEQHQLAGSQAFTLSGLASTHFLAASSSDSLSPAIYLATRFWSSLVQVKFLISVAAGLPEFMNSVRAILFSGVAS